MPGMPGMPAPGSGPLQMPQPPAPQPTEDNRPDLIKPTEEEIEAIKKAIDKAIEEESKLREIRLRAYNAYHRQKNAFNNRKNRAQYIGSAAPNVVDTTLPHLIKRFMAHDNGMSIDGPDKQVAKALLSLVSSTIHEQGGFRFIHDSLKDALVGDNVTGKAYWKNIFGDAQKLEYGGLTADEIDYVTDMVGQAYRHAATG